MKFYPRNRYLLVEKQLEKEEDNKGFILPDDYKRKDGPLQIVKLLNACEGSNYVQDEGKFLVVPSHLVESFEVEEQTFCITPENAVYGVMVKV